MTKLAAAPVVCKPQRLHIQLQPADKQGGGGGLMVIPYLVSKLSQPVRLQQQRGSEEEGGDKTKYEICGRSYDSNKEEEAQKEKCQNGKLKETKQANVSLVGWTPSG